MKKILSGVLAVGALTVLAACSGSSADDRFIVAQGANPVSLLPWGSNDQPSSRVSAQIYDTLLVVGEDNNPTTEGGLAVSVENDTASPEKWTITIDSEVKFHNGDLLTPEDVAYSIESAAASSETFYIVGTLKQKEDKMTNSACWSKIDELAEGAVEGEDYFTSGGNHYAGTSSNPVIISRNCIADDAVVASGTDTVVVTYDDVYAPFENVLTHTALGIVNKEVVEATEEYGFPRTVNVVGTGPYELKRWTVSGTTGEIDLDSYSDYWNNDTYPDRIPEITIRSIEDNQSRANALFGRQIHMAYDLQASDQASVGDYSFLELVQEPNLSYAYIGFNMLEEKDTCGLDYNPFAGVTTDQAVIDQYFDDEGLLILSEAENATGELKATLQAYALRQSINLATDSQSIIDAPGVLNGSGTLASSPLSDAVFGSSNKVTPYGYALEDAKDLAKFAGFEKGSNTIDCEIWTNANATRRTIAEITQSNLAEIGLNLSIVEQEWSTYLEETGLGNHDMFILGWTTVTGDADYGLYALFHSSAHGASGNRTFYSNSDVDAALEVGRTSPDNDDRLASYETALLNIKRDAPNISLYNGMDNVGHIDSIEGFELDRSGAHRLYKISAY